LVSVGRRAAPAPSLAFECKSRDRGPQLGFPPTNFLAVSSFLIESLVWNTANSAEAATISRCELP